MILGRHRSESYWLHCPTEGGETVGYQTVQPLPKAVLTTFICFTCTVHLKELKDAFKGNSSNMVLNNTALQAVKQHKHPMEVCQWAGVDHAKLVKIINISFFCDLVANATENVAVRAHNGE